MIITVTKHGSIIIFRLKGDFFLESVHGMEKNWDEVIVENPEVIAFDCRELVFLDSAAIGTFVKFMKVSQEKDIDLFFINLLEPVNKIFKTARLDNYIRVIPEKEFIQKYKLPK